MLNNYRKIYKFDYENKAKKLLCYLIQLMANSAVVIFLFIIYFIVMQVTIAYVKNETVKSFLTIPFTIVLSLLVLFFISFTFFPRKVIINDNYIKIQKNAMNFFAGKKWFSTIVPYSSIVSCSMLYKEIAIKNSAFIRQQTYPCTFFNWDSLVKITDKYGVNYYIPVEDSDDFIMIVELHLASTKDI